MSTLVYQGGLVCRHKKGITVQALMTQFYEYRWSINNAGTVSSTIAPASGFLAVPLEHVQHYPGKSLAACRTWFGLV